MRSEHSAKLSLQTKHAGKALITKKQGKHDTIGTMITSWATKFVVVLVAVVIVKHFFF